MIHWMLVDGAWHAICITSDGERLSVFVDGVFVGTKEREG